MALESKPLFHPELLRQQVRAFNLPERVADWQPKLQEWARLIASGRADNFKETALLPDFLADILCRLLGYTGPVGPADTHNSHNSHHSHLSDTVPAASANTFTFSRERHVEVDGKVADERPPHPKQAAGRLSPFLNSSGQRITVVKAFCSGLPLSRRPPT